jgi:hypothetical protein
VDRRLIDSAQKEWKPGIVETFAELPGQPSNVLCPEVTLEPTTCLRPDDGAPEPRSLHGVRRILWRCWCE